MKKHLELLNRIKELRKDNPNFAVSIEHAFPEIVDDTPFIYIGQLFVRKLPQINIYQLRFNRNAGKFYIHNVNSQEDWKGRVVPSNSDFDKYVIPPMGDLYLTERGFSILLSMSGVKLNRIKLLSKENLTKFVAEKWEEKS